MTDRVLVTGACGFVGSHLIEHLLKSDARVIATDLEKAKRTAYYVDRKDADTKLPEPRYYGNLLDEMDVRFIPADITDLDSLERVFQYEYDTVFHTASLYDYFAGWDRLYKVNVEGARNMGEIAAENGVDHFIHWSTLGVCGSSDTKSQPLTEETGYAPHNRYGRSKMKQEQALFEISDRQNLPVTVLRPAPIYGPRNRYGVYHLLYLYRKVGTGLVFPVYPRHHQPRFPSVHVSDVVRAALFARDNPAQTRGEIYHVTSDPIRQDELVTFIARSLGLPVKRVPLPWPIYKRIAGRLVKLAERLEQRARTNDKRPKFPASMAQYLESDFWFSNEKLKSAGFEYNYEDPKDGLWNYITWCKRRGML